MGLKRKASALEETSTSLSPERASPPALSSQPSSQTSSAGPSEPEQYNFWNIAGAPYFNSRTRKRFRDGRPSAETIHEATLKKLYDAQRQQQTGAVDERSQTKQGEGHNSDIPGNRRITASALLVSGPPNRVETPTDRNQRSIQSFFDSVNPHVAPGDRADTPESVSPPPRRMFTAQPPLPASIYQPQESVPHLVSPHPSTLPSVLTCEDCFSPLLTNHSGEAIDAEMLDVNGPTRYMDPEIEAEGWTCALCAKRVCDTCAVRGDYRVCLECAVPGGGRYNPEELREKRWVGGIGWM